MSDIRPNRFRQTGRGSMNVGKSLAAGLLAAGGMAIALAAGL